MIDSEGWEHFIVAFFGVLGVDEKWIDHITINWNALKDESACGCVIAYGELNMCDGYKRIVEIRNTKARLEELERIEAMNAEINNMKALLDENDEPLGEKSELY